VAGYWQGRQLSSAPAFDSVRKSPSFTRAREWILKLQRQQSLSLHVPIVTQFLDSIVHGHLRSGGR
jgi:hypothetical protein